MAQQQEGLFSEAAGHIHYEIFEIRPRRHLHVCTISRKETNKSPTSMHQHASAADDSESGTTVFLIHGVAGSVEVWRSQFDLIQAPAVAKIVAVDLIGHGQSSALREKEAYHFEAIAQDINELFTRFRSVSNMIIGHSYGYRQYFLSLYTILLLFCFISIIAILKNYFKV